VLFAYQLQKEHQCIAIEGGRHLIARRMSNMFCVWTNYTTDAQYLYLW